MPAVAPHIRLGRSGEELAAAILARGGYRVLARNWRFGKLELDLICENGRQIVFVEVKTRSSDICGGGLGAITKAKKRRLALAAEAWLGRNGMWGRPCRFDVVCLTGAAGNFRMEHYRNAFEFTEAMDCGGAHWQPW